MGVETTKPITTRMDIMYRLRRRIRSRARRLRRPNTKLCQIILITTDRLTRTTRLPRLAKSDRFPTSARVRSLASISSFPMNTSRATSEVTTRRTRLTRMIRLAKRRRLNRCWGLGYAAPTNNAGKIRLAISDRRSIMAMAPRLTSLDRPGK